jgi:hypothetical protein
MRLDPLHGQRHRNMPMEATLVVAMVMQRYRVDRIARSDSEGALQGHLATTSGHVKAPHRTIGTAI